MMSRSASGSASRPNAALTPNSYIPPITPALPARPAVVGWGGGECRVNPSRNARLPWYFAGYGLGTGALFLFLPRLVGDPYLMPWHYWWVFVFVTPPAAGLILGRGVRSGRFSGWAVAAFVVASVLLGAGYLWVAVQLMAVV
jgi:hypothetical protein